jgi:predicted DNA-binding mobile mystery protein A
MVRIKQLVSRQYRATVDGGSARWAGAHVPPEGWLRTVRKALSMTLRQVGERLGTTRAAVSRVEQAELDESVSLRTMRRGAEAMGCRFVYAVVPGEPVLQLLVKRAREQARNQLTRANQQMSLEAQELSPSQLEAEVERLAQEKVHDLSSRLWDDP